MLTFVSRQKLRMINNLWPRELWKEIFAYTLNIWPVSEATEQSQLYDNRRCRREKVKKKKKRQKDLPEFCAYLKWFFRRKKVRFPTWVKALRVFYYKRPKKERAQNSRDKINGVVTLLRRTTAILHRAKSPSIRKLYIYIYVER